MTQFDKRRKKHSGKAAVPRSRRLLRALPLALLLGLGVGAWLFLQLDDQGLYSLQAQHERLALLVEARPLQAALAYLLAYILVVALSLPLASLLTLLGGYLFGLLPGALLAAGGATIGAGLLFLAARTALGGWLQARAGTRLARLQEGFQRGAFSYLLVLRLIPLFPFWLVNLAPALLGVRFGAYLAATALGILPASLVYAGVGRGLGSLLSANQELGVSLLLEARVLLPLLGLALLSLLPLLYRAWRQRRVPYALEVPEGRESANLKSGHAEREEETLH